MGKTFTDEKIVVHHIDVGNLDSSDVAAYLESKKAASPFKDFDNIIEVFVPGTKPIKPIEFINF